MMPMLPNERPPVEAPEPETYVPDVIVPKPEVATVVAPVEGGKGRPTSKPAMPPKPE